MNLKLSTRISLGVSASVLAFGVTAYAASAIFPDANLNKLVTESMGKKTVTAADVASLGYLSDYDGTAKIKSLKGLEKATNLGSLNLNGNQISDLTPLKGLTKLEYLFLGSNQIASAAPVSGLSKLVLLDLSKNKVTDVAPLKSLKKLQSLDISNNGVKDISPLASLTGLQIFHAGGNKLTDANAVAGMSKLGELDLSNNQLKSIKSLQNLKNARAILLGGNKFSDLSAVTALGAKKSVTDSTYLWLDVKQNGLSKLSGIEKMTRLEQLDVSFNQLTDISGIVKLMQAQKSYPFLSQLNLSGNKIADIGGLSQVARNIDVLNIKGNPVNISSPTVQKLFKQIELNGGTVVASKPVVKDSKAAVMKLITVTGSEKYDIYYSGGTYYNIPVSLNPMSFVFSLYKSQNEDGAAAANPAKPGTLTLKVSQALLYNTNSAKLAIWYQGGDNKWVKVGGTFDKAAHTITVPLKNSGNYAILESK
ncbi:leucine-rich repeat domain-containing protein [Paenibacillus sp. OV219]|uniref:leucine-rich repeat domain-containing protein n=1 Tax=Paenibacillus sp. OV219 TaxID=1884377 RepID=UPI0008C1E9D8|nr:leucine-rich repeat domain-containing protein [Paenibacillus sp. OV219]SEP12862.1 Leucine Rich repeat-containing protein [Paenibacillus sp. OV219]